MSSAVGVGPKIYFPSFILAMLRPPPNFPQNKAIFQCPPMLNKYDIRNYLEALYGIKVLELNTVRYLGSRRRDPLGRTYRQAHWKKAVVTMDKPFTYPEAISS